LLPINAGPREKILTGRSAPGVYYARRRQPVHPIRFAAFWTLLVFTPPTMAAGPAAEVVQRVPNNPYTQYRTRDALEREITFYLSDVPDGVEAERLPLFVFIHGSGAQPLFSPWEDGRIVGKNGQNPILMVVRRKARLLLVEKPGVEPYVETGPGGSAQNASAAFREEHTLDRWSKAVEAAIRAAWTLPDIDASRTLVSGHSEGGIVACRVAAEVPEVTHVASLAGCGVTQLYDLMELAREGNFYQHAGATGEARVAALLRDWQGVLDDPDSTEKEFLGHPNRRWSTFLRSSPTKELMRTTAKVFLAQGTADTAVSVHSFDVAVAELLAHGRDVTWRRIDGADHSFNRPPTASSGSATGSAPPAQPVDGWREIWGEVLAWFEK
jgi:dipeptidyl aminopeptidase/acylaminoacyl peptidase